MFAACTYSDNNHWEVQSKKLFYPTNITFAYKYSDISFHHTSIFLVEKIEQKKKGKKEGKVTVEEE